MTTAVRPRVAVCDYGVGNMRSVERALQRGGAEVTVTSDRQLILNADGVVLPGVGAFGTAASALRSLDLVSTIGSGADSGRPLVGVCLGFQLLFTDSEEGTGGRGLDLLPGHVRRLRAAAATRVPHVGWNRTSVLSDSPLFTGVASGAFLYYTHSYAVLPDDRTSVIATTDHTQPVVAAVACGNVVGTQFHPEKSGAAGLRMYANFVAWCAAVPRVQHAPRH